MEPTGQREALPDDELRAIRERCSRISLPLHAGYEPSLVGFANLAPCVMVARALVRILRTHPKMINESSKR
jgi:hypothetical protein